MKRKIPLLLILFLLGAVILAGCAQPPTLDVTPETAATTEAQTAERATPAPEAAATPEFKTWAEAPEMTIDPNTIYVATIKTEHGDIVVELDAKNAPITTNNFVFLAREG
ncbi:MAG TPA: peptidylprolyl isomerase, partial [Anaerolineae bacterium]|nr:peptidylprolyl isomerase [Anaerolineae bacterium]